MVEGYSGRELLTSCWPEREREKGGGVRDTLWPTAFSRSFPRSPSPVAHHVVSPSVASFSVEVSALVIQLVSTGSPVTTPAWGPGLYHTRLGASQEQARHLCRVPSLVSSAILSSVRMPAD